MTSDALAELEELYLDAAASAKNIGLQYISDSEEGINRQKQGKGFCYKLDESLIDDKETKDRVDELSIPPAWEDVWICTDPSGHIQVTGRDEQGRKQYIYHDKWRTMRDLINFYRTILFAKDLPHIRSVVREQLQRNTIDREQILAAMLWILDNSHIRIGNDVYYEERESIGLTTMLDSSVEIKGPVMSFNFMGKSGKQQMISLEDAKVAKIVKYCKELKGERLFKYINDDKEMVPLTSNDLNELLSSITKHSISAKDFRTWGGTLAAFDHLTKDFKKDNDTKPEKVVLEALDKAAEDLGNTRNVARKHYVHPHILESYGTKYFAKYYESAQEKSTVQNLSKRETELLRFLEQLFESEFKLLKQMK